VRVDDVGGRGRPVTVLIADDNEVAQRLCRRVLEKTGYKVLTASDGLEAVELALANSPDLILMDLAMPRMSGSEAMRRIKAQRPGIAIVIASAILVAADRERFLAAGADHVMIKPFRLDDLLAVVAKFAANRGPQMRAPVPDGRHPGQLSPEGKYYWDGQRWVPEALMAEEGFVPGVPVPEQARDLDRLAADLEAVWYRVESGQLALGEPNEDFYSLFETLIAGLRAPRAGNGSGPSPRMRAMLRAKHRPVIQALLGRKYEDDDGLAVAAWDGKVRLGCRCGWRDFRAEPASTAPASAGSLSDAWREHVIADMVGME
jgi:two-component system cell cycle response regulator DivK